MRIFIVDTLLWISTRLINVAEWCNNTVRELLKDTDENDKDDVN